MTTPTKPSDFALKVAHRISDLQFPYEPTTLVEDFAQIIDAELKPQREAMELAKAALEESQWADNSGGEYKPKCPYCEASLVKGHTDACKIKIALSSLNL